MYGECHAHIFMNGYNYMEAVELHRGHVCANEIRRWFGEYQKRGVTFIRDGGDALGVSAAARNIAPDYGIDYRTPLFAIHKKGHYGGIVGYAFEDLKGYRKLVGRVKKERGDFIKIMVSGIIRYEQFGAVTGVPLEQEEIREMVHIAHEEGFAVMVHANSASAVRSAVLSGADSIEHGNYIDRDCIQAMAAYQTVWVPTLATIRNLLGCGRYPEEPLQQIYRSVSENVRYAFKEGVMLALGSDAGAYLVPHGQGILDEQEAFEEILGKRQELEEKLQAGENKICCLFQSRRSD